MSWTVEFERLARKEFKKLGVPDQKKIIRYLREKVAPDPRRFGKALGGNLSGLWRYRVGDHRIVCRIEDDNLVVLIIRIAHRSRVYQRRS
ncbi:MAG: type II toxin-antitoxin system RelE/ParE family toxin [Bacteroidota bacterium]